MYVNFRFKIMREFTEDIPAPARVIAPELRLHDPDCCLLPYEESEFVGSYLQKHFIQGHADFSDSGFENFYFSLLNINAHNINNYDKFIKSFSSIKNIQIAKNITWISLYSVMSKEIQTKILKKMYSDVYDTLALDFFDARTQNLPLIHCLDINPKKDSQNASQAQWCEIVTAAIFNLFKVIHFTMNLDPAIAYLIEENVQHILLGLSYETLQSTSPLFHSHVYERLSIFDHDSCSFYPHTLELVEFVTSKKNFQNEEEATKKEKKLFKEQQIAQNMIGLSYKKQWIRKQFQKNTKPVIHDDMSELMKRAFEIKGIKIPPQRTSYASSRIIQAPGVDLQLALSNESHKKTIDKYAKQRNKTVTKVCKLEAKCGKEIVKQHEEAKYIEHSLIGAKAMYTYLEKRMKDKQLNYNLNKDQVPKKDELTDFIDQKVQLILNEEGISV